MKIKDLGKYLLYEDGKLQNKKNGKILKPLVNSKGYLFYIVDLDGKIKTHLVHRLIYKNFIGIIDAKLEVNHKDGNKTNNYPTNLELLTHKENVLHAVKIGKIKKGKNSPVSKGEIEMIHPITKVVLKTYGCQRQAALEEKISYSSICCCVNGLRLSAGGYLWRYKNIDNG